MNYFPLNLGDTLAQRNAKLRLERIKAARAKASHTADEWRGRIAEFGARCVRCGCIPSERLQKDHIVPIYQGGSDGLENLQPLCRTCNASKGPDSFNWAEHRKAVGFADGGK